MLWGMSENILAFKPLFAPLVKYALESGKIQKLSFYRKKTFLLSLLSRGVTIKLTFKNFKFLVKIMKTFLPMRKNFIFNKDRQYYM